MSTAIEWTDVTDNIIAVDGGGWWCRKISPGCANCYAEKLNKNAFFGGNMANYTGEPPKLILRREILAGWERQRKPKKHFVASMTDVFGDWVPQEWIDEILTAMMLADKQTFQVLTKRPGVANERIRDFLGRKGIAHLTANIWIGTSVENQECADMRIPNLLKIPAKVCFLSCEPLLGPVDLRLERLRANGYGVPVGPALGRNGQSKWTGEGAPMIHWVICGGESGKKARPMHPDWARSLRDQCQAAGVAFFFKQWGEWSPYASHDFYPENKPLTCIKPDGELSWCSGDLESLSNWSENYESTDHPIERTVKKHSGRLLDGREWREFPKGGEA